MDPSFISISIFITKDKSRQQDYNQSISTPRAFIDCCCLCVSVCVCITESMREGIWQPCTAADLFCCAGDYSLQRAASADTLRPIDWSPGLTLLSRTCLPYWSEVAWHTMTTSPVEPMGCEGVGLKLGSISLENEEGLSGIESQVRLCLGETWVYKDFCTFV